MKSLDRQTDFIKRQIVERIGLLRAVTVLKFFGLSIAHKIRL